MRLCRYEGYVVVRTAVNSEFFSLGWVSGTINLEGKYSLESTDPRESEIRAPPQPLPYLMPIPPNTLSTPTPSNTPTKT